MRVWLVALALALVSPAAAQTQLFLGDQIIASGPGQGEETMSAEPSASASQVTLSTLGALGPLPLVGEAATPATSHAWYWDGQWSRDEQLTVDVAVTLWLSAATPSSGELRLRLDDVAPDGSATILAASSTGISVTSATPAPRDFLLLVQDALLQENHTLRLVAAVEGVTSSLQIDYGGQSDSNIRFVHEGLDSDGDGILDSDERRNGSNPLDPQSPAPALVADDPAWPVGAAIGLLIACFGAAAVGLYGRHAL